MKNKKLFEELEKINQDNYKIFIDSLKSHSLEVFSVTLETKLSDELMKDFELNDDIKFLCEINPNGGKMRYYYKGVEVEPDGHYILPDNYKAVSTLLMLQECISQDTYKPNIKKLETV